MTIREGEENMAGKRNQRDVRDDPRYHDTRRLLRKYRDVTWSLELSVQRLRSQFHVEYGTDIEEFLDTVYLAGANLGGTELEHHAQCIERSHKMLTLVQNAVELLRTRHKNGEIYYWLLYYTYLSPQQFQNTEEIIEQLQPHTRDISRTSYFRKLEKAVEALSSILWGYTAKDSISALTGLISPQD